MYCIAML